MADRETNTAKIKMALALAHFEDQAGQRVYLVPTGETHNGEETYTRHDERVPMADQEVLFTGSQVAGQAEDAARHPDEFTLEEYLAESNAADAARWQPIETAPKDGSEILLADRGDVGSGFWHDGSGCYGHRGGAGWFCERDRGTLLTASNCHPTHWQPLPPPPSAQQAGQAETGEPK